MDSIRRFPTSAGVLLGASLALHLASLTEAIFGTAVASAALFLSGQFALALALLRLYDGKWVIQDIRLLFVIFFFLYGGTLPLVILVGLGSASDPGLAGAAFMYGTAFVGFNIVQWWYRRPWHDIPREVFSRIRPSFGNAVVLLAGFAWIAAYAMSRGIEISLTIDRSQVRFLGTQLWVVSMFAVNGLAMYMFAGWENLTRAARIALVISVAAFIVFQLSMGNRRDFLPMLLFLVGIIATRRHAVIRFGTVVVGFVAFVLFTLVGVVRQLIQDPAMLLRVSPVDVLLTQNEFVSPIYTLMYYVTTSRPLRLGWTYLSAPSLFVPRAIWPDKPESLSIQFMRDAFGTTGLMGFAYTPVTEAFLNFWWVGPFIVFAVLSLLMVKLVKNADAHPGLYFIAFALVVDFHRGDFGGTFYAMVVVGGAYAMMSLISRIRWAPRQAQAMWPAIPRSGGGQPTMATH